MASIDNPHYTAVILTKSGTKYKITDAMTSLSLDEQENGIAQKATVTIMQTKVGPKYITTLVSVHDQLYVYADTGSGAKEVFRGYIWEKTYQKDETKEFTMVAFDRLIYLQESEAYKFYPSGKTTKAIFTDICKDKGIKLSYNYSSIKHAKLVIRGTLADAFTEDLLEEVRKKNGKRGIIRSTKGNIEVLEEGKGNKTVYKLYHGQSGNIISSKHTVTMSGITTKVIILGSEKDEKAAPIRATVVGDTKSYGTITKIISSNDDDKLDKLKKEAKQLLKDDGKPKREVEVNAIDNPWIRKGDKIHLDDGWYKGYAYVKAITHDAMNKSMSLEVRLT